MISISSPFSAFTLPFPSTPGTVPGVERWKRQDKQTEKSSVVRLPMPVAVIVRGGVWLGQLGDRHWQSPAFSFQARDLILSRKASGSDENHASSSPEDGTMRPHSANFPAGLSASRTPTISSAAP